MRCAHSMLRGLCVVVGCSHWDGAGRLARQQAKGVKRTCATCPAMTTKVHCTACSNTTRAKNASKPELRMQVEK